MFSTDDRDRVRDRIIERATSDPRVVAAAAVGSLATGGGDRWSDLDLTFGVDETVALSDVIDDWTGAMAREFDAVALLDLAVGATVYRVFLLPDGLQVDLSFAPAPEFRQAGPTFRLLFGEHVTRYPPPPSAPDVFGWSVVFALHARACIERGRPWQAEHAVSAVRDHALNLACLRRGLPAAYGRGFDELPPDLLDRFADTLVRSLERDELRRALGAAVHGLLGQTDDVRDLAARVEPQLRRLVAETSPGPPSDAC